MARPRHGLDQYTLARAEPFAVAPRQVQRVRLLGEGSIGPSKRGAQSQRGERERGIELERTSVPQAGRVVPPGAIRRAAGEVRVQGRQGRTRVTRKPLGALAGGLDRELRGEGVDE